MSDPDEHQSPPVTDSDLMFLAIKRLERVAEKMMAKQYDEELDDLMATAAEWFDWAEYNIARRAGLTQRDKESFKYMTPRLQENMQAQVIGHLLEQGYRVEAPGEDIPNG